MAMNVEFHHEATAEVRAAIAFYEAARWHDQCDA